MVFFTLNRPRFSCVPGFLPFRRSTVSVTARKPRWIQEYIVLKLRTPTNSAPTISSGDQVCCNLDSIKAANCGVNFVSLPLLADLLIATCCALIAEYSPTTRFNSLATVEWWIPIKLAILRTEYPFFLKNFYLTSFFYGKMYIAHIKDLRVMYLWLFTFYTRSPI